MSEDHKSLHDREEDTKHAIREQVAEIASFWEILISGIVMVGLILSAVPLVRDMPHLITSGQENVFHEFLEHAFNLVIGVEFIKMLAKHSPGSALEVLLYAIARHMVLDSGSALNNLLGVASIGLIFAIRKFVFVPSFGSSVSHGKLAPDMKELVEEALREEGQEEPLAASVEK